LTSLKVIAAAEKKQGEAAHVPGSSNGTPKKKVTSPAPVGAAPKGHVVPVQKVTPPSPPGLSKGPKPAPTQK
jgi:hypothetical protein